MSEIKSIFWDNGGVILTNGWDRPARQRAAEKFRFDWAEYEERNGLIFDAFESGRMTLDEYLHRSVFYRERSFTPEGFKEFMFAQSQPYPESLDLLAALVRAGRRLFASLNNEALELNEYRIEKFNLRSYFSVFFSSCYLGVRKPDPRIYRLALKITQCTPEECIFIDDREVNVESAREVGIHGIQFQSVEQLRNDLASFGVTTDRK
jgi:putative hydrolase of the HAD superfamily